MAMRYKKDASIRSHVRGVLCCVVLGLPAAAAVQVPPSGYHGSSCIPASSADRANAAYNNFGAFNSYSAASADVVCGGSLLAGQPVMELRVTVYDRNPSADVKSAPARPLQEDER